MKFSAIVVLAAAAMGVSAHPSRHAHHNAHRSVAGGEFVMAQRPASVSAAPEATAATTVVPPPSTPEASAAASSASSSPDSGFKPFCGGNDKRADLAQILYAGNTGTAAKPGCNIMEIDANAVSHYNYTMTFANNGTSDEVCACWNKIGPDGGVNGFFENNQALNFKLPAKGKGNAYVAVQGNSQVGCACGPGKVPTTSFGQFAATWVEADFGNESNKEWSGFDASALVSAKYGLNIPAMKVCGQGVCSTIYAGGGGDNAYLGGMEKEDGVGGNIMPGPLALTVTVN